MTSEEKKLVEKLLLKAEKFEKDSINQKEIEQDDKSFLEELENGINTASYVFDLARSQKLPNWIKKWLKRLWYNMKIAIANTLREIACSIDPTCK